jgi:hypothetical protein
MDVKTLVKKWLLSRKREPETEYEETKRKFEMVIGKPFITIKLEIPDGFEELSNEFLKLEKDNQFHEEVKDLIKKRLLIDKRQKKSSTLKRRPP